jgi:hypothetical protein
MAWIMDEYSRIHGFSFRTAAFIVAIGRVGRATVLRGV